MIVPHRDSVTAWRAFDGAGVVAVRIWWRSTPWGGFQRHEWRRPDGTTWAETWIPARVAPRTMSAVGQPVDPADLMARALRSIANGHNDARQLAADVLASVGL